MSSGQEANYTNWDTPSEPSDNSGEENCAHISMAKWQWNDRPCEDTSQNNRYTYHALCEMETTTPSGDQSEEELGEICFLEISMFLISHQKFDLV